MEDTDMSANTCQILAELKKIMMFNQFYIEL